MITIGRDCGTGEWIIDDNYFIFSGINKDFYDHFEAFKIKSEQEHKISEIPKGFVKIIQKWYLRKIDPNYSKLAKKSENNNYIE